MKKHILLFLCFIFLLDTRAFAGKYESKDFIIYSDLNPRYVQFVEENAKAYQQCLQGQYFRKSWEKPLTIYYCESESEAKQLLIQHGHKDGTVNCNYIADIPAIYAYRVSNDGQICGWGNMFHEITHYFVDQNFEKAPEWLSEGLSSFLGEQGEIVNGKLIVGEPKSRCTQMLKDKIDEGLKLSIKHLLSTSKEQLYEWSIGRQFSQMLFYWLYENGELEKYLENLQKNVYGPEVLEETVSKSSSRINNELLKFIKKYCDVCTYLQDGLQTKDLAAKKHAFNKALELKPDCLTAQLELAKCYYQGKDYEKCLDNLKRILEHPKTIEYRRAAWLSGDSYYDMKKYKRALEYYNKAWEYSELYEYKYRLAYRIGNCCYYLKDLGGAKQWYEKFLACKWDGDTWGKQVEYAKKYIEYKDKAEREPNQPKEKINDSNEEEP